MKSEENTPLDTNKRGKGFGSGNNVRREAFTGTSEALNALQVKFDCMGGNNQLHVRPRVDRFFQNKLENYPYYESIARENGEV